LFHCQQPTRRADELFQDVFEIVLDLIITQINKCTEKNLVIMKYLAFAFYWHAQCNLVVGKWILLVHLSDQNLSLR